MNFNIRTVTGHFILWLVYFLYVWLPNSSIDDNLSGYFLYSCLNVPIAMVATYFAIHVTVEKYLLRGKIWQFWLSLAFSLVLFGTIRRVLNYTYMVPMLWPEKMKYPMIYFPKMVYDAVSVLLIAAVGVMIHLIKKWNEQQRISESLMREKVAAELELLKSQVQPHFIFNTLNNIYMLSLKNSTQTSDMIYRLSALLSYMLYDSKQMTIGIEKEIDYIKNYINLEKIRYGERLDVQFGVFKNVKNVQVPPLLFLPLVENAFKHGVSNEVDKSWIHIDVFMKKNALIFKIENSLPDKSFKRVPNGFGNGLGLDNLKKRLEIFYPGKYDLKIMDDEDSWLAILRIDIEHLTEGLSITPLEIPLAEPQPAKAVNLAAKLSPFVASMITAFKH